MIAERILADLDRCQHGRHIDDPCTGCPEGMSIGNPHMRPGDVIGYGLDGVEIVMPDRARKYNPSNWYRKSSR